MTRTLLLMLRINLAFIRAVADVLKRNLAMTDRAGLNTEIVNTDKAVTDAIARGATAANPDFTAEVTALQAIQAKAAAFDPAPPAPPAV